MTVKLYVTPSSTSSRKAKAFLERNKIEFTEQNMVYETLTQEQLFEILSHTENGVEDILSTRSLDYKRLSKQGVDFEELSLTKLHKLVVDYPRLLRAPVMVTKKLTLVGYNDEEIQMLLNREDKKKEFQRVLNRIRAMEDKERGELGMFRMTKHECSTDVYQKAI